MNSTYSESSAENVGYCRDCGVEVPQSEVSMEEDSIGEHTECGTDLWLSEAMVTKIVVKWEAQYA